MSIKIIKVAKDLNVGISSVVDFLKGKGLKVESNPNAKITDEQYILVVKELGKGLPEAERVRLLSRPAQEAPPLPSPPAARKPQEVKKQEIIKTEIPEDIKPKFTTIGKIDLATLEAMPETKRKSPKEERPRREPAAEAKKEPDKIKSGNKEKKEPAKENRKEPVVSGKKEENRPEPEKIAAKAPEQAPQPQPQPKTPEAREKEETPAPQQPVETPVNAAPVKTPEAPAAAEVNVPEIKEKKEAPEDEVFRLKPKLE
ncbi:MAG: hypothetical protein LBD27_05295, partial [Tannerella sp.]|nr:hypothetical protein [Tannerella sp.]